MKSKFPQVTLIYDRYSKASPIKKATVEIRITHDKRQKYISTGVQLYPHQWKKGMVTDSGNDIQLNRMLRSLVDEVMNALIEMSEEGCIDIFQVPQRIEKRRSGKVTFLDFCIQRAEIRKYGKAPDSQQRYDRFIRLFREWGRIIEFSDLTEMNIIAYDRYLAGRGLKTYSKWNNYHRFLNSFILDAIDAGYVQRNPYRWVNINRGEKISSMKRYLSPEEFEMIREAVMPTRSTERIRDLFVFQTYTCMSYSDLRKFAPESIKEIKGMKVYTGKRKKTGKEFTIPLLKPALDILGKYDGKLPVISNVKYNEYLKVVAQAAGIDRPVSSHWARHTGATLLLNSGVDMKIVSKICGHSSTRITEQVYAKLLDETVVDAISEIAE